jgi:hypothetical protein
MQIPSFAKAIVGAVVAGLAPVATAAATSSGGVTTGSVAASVISALVGGVLTYFVPNGKGVSGLVVTVKTDVDRFLSTFVAGLPGLVKSSAEAAIQPAPEAAPVTETAPPVAQ